MDDPLADPLRRGVTPAAAPQPAENQWRKSMWKKRSLNRLPNYALSQHRRQNQHRSPSFLQRASRRQGQPTAVDDLFGEPAAAAPAEDPVVAR